MVHILRLQNRHHLIIFRWIYLKVSVGDIMRVLNLFLLSFVIIVTHALFMILAVF